MLNSSAATLIDLSIGLTSGLAAGRFVKWSQRTGFWRARIKAGIAAALALSCAVILPVYGNFHPPVAQELQIPAIALSAFVSGVYASRLQSQRRSRTSKRARTRGLGQPYQCHQLFTPFPTDYLRGRPPTAPLLDILPLVQRLDNIIHTHPKSEAPLGRDRMPRMKKRAFMKTDRKLA